MKSPPGLEFYAFFSKEKWPVWAFQQLLGSREIPIHYNVEDYEECGITGDGGQRTEIRDQMTEVRSQKSEDKKSTDYPSIIFQSYPSVIRFTVTRVNFTGHGGAGADFRRFKKTRSLACGRASFPILHYTV
jgi:hypothetical protein